MAQVAQSGAIWSPSPKQLAALEAAKEAGFNKNICAIAKAAHVPRRTLYNWLENDPGFVHAWEGLWKFTLSRHLPGIVAAVVKKAQKGDTQAARLTCDLMGILKQAQRNPADPPPGDFSDLSNEALDARIADYIRKVGIAAFTGGEGQAPSKSPAHGNGAA